MADYSFDHHHSGQLSSDVILGGLEDMSLTLDGGTTTTLAGETTSTINSDATVTLHPVSTTADVTLRPLSVDSKVDLEPVAVDSCLRLDFAPLPPTQIDTPYEQRWAISLLGLELLALSVCGRTSTEVRPAPRRPVVLGGEEHRGADDHHDHHDHHDHQAPATVVIEL